MCIASYLVESIFIFTFFGINFSNDITDGAICVVIIILEIVYFVIWYVWLLCIIFNFKSQFSCFLIILLQKECLGIIFKLFYLFFMFSPVLYNNIYLKFVYQFYYFINRCTSICCIFSYFVFDSINVLNSFHII